MFVCGRNVRGTIKHNHCLNSPEKSHLERKTTRSQWRLWRFGSEDAWSHYKIHPFNGDLSHYGIKVFEQVSLSSVNSINLLSSSERLILWTLKFPPVVSFLATKKRWLALTNIYKLGTETQSSPLLSARAHGSVSLPVVCVVCSSDIFVVFKWIWMSENGTLKVFIQTELAGDLFHATDINT